MVSVSPSKAINQFVSHLKNYSKLNDYKKDPIRFAKDHLSVHLWSKQEEILQALHTPPHRVLVRTANEIGKSFVAAVALLHFYLTRDPSVSIITAPNARQVDDIVFSEIRALYGNRSGIYPKASIITDHSKHLLKGFTARHESGFQGYHSVSQLIVFDEAIGIAREFWMAARGVLSGGNESLFLVICNPTDSSSQAYLEEQSGNWNVISISAFDHPNIINELKDEKPLIPGCVRLEDLKRNMVSTPSFGSWITEDEYQPGIDTDLWQFEGGEKHFPQRYWKSGPEGDARILGRYPVLSAYSLFSEAMFQTARLLIPTFTNNDNIVIGCDIARFGDDDTTIHVRRGFNSIYHTSYNGYDTAHTAGQLKDVARKLAPQCNMRPEEVPIIIDDCGVGGGVVDQRGEFRFIPIVAQSKGVIDEEHYRQIRSESAFSLATLLRTGKISLAKLDSVAIQKIQLQAVGITYKLDKMGKLMVERKDETKKRLGRSPDDLDAMILCYYPIAGVHTVAKPIERDKPQLFTPDHGETIRRVFNANRGQK